MSDDPAAANPGPSRRAVLCQGVAGVSAVAVAAAAGHLLTAPQVAGAQTARRGVNVLLLMSDEHHADWTSVAGHPTVRTPNLQTLAERGTVFDSAYCPSPLCRPSRSAFLAGRRVHQIQCYNNCNVIDHDDPTYGGVLRDQGVHSVYVGKTDVYRSSDRLGFGAMLEPGDRRKPGDELIRRIPLDIRADAAGRAGAFGPHPRPFDGDEKKMAAALKWLEESAPRRDRPWTLSVNLSKPHFPHYVTQELWDMYPDGGDLPACGRDEPSARHPRARDLREHFQTDRFTDEQIRGLRRGYLGCVTYIDRQLGRLIETLRRTGQLDNTLVIYTSDHGDMLGKFGMWWKCSLYDDSARVPLIVAGPGFEAGRRVRTPVDLLDVQATIFHAVGARRPADWVGTPLQQIAPDDDQRVVFSEYHGHGARASSYLVRRGRWKLIYHVDAPHQLFDLQADPQERINRYEQEPAIARELEQELRRICDPQVEHARAAAMIQRQIAAIDAAK